MELKESLITNVVVAGIDTKDAPDFCDAYIESALYDGEPMTEEQLDEINQDSGFIHEQVYKHLY
jgi:ribosome-binding factor A